MPAEEIIVTPLGPDHYEDWDEFCLSNSECWFWHTSRWLEYTLHYRPDLHPKSHSFSCLLQDRVVAVCPLIIENRAEAESAREFSYGGDAGPEPAIADSLPDATRKKVTQTVFRKIDTLARELKIGRASFRASPLAPSFWRFSHPPINPLVKVGYHDISFATQVLDLSLDEAQLLRRMRKGHRADVTRGEKMLETRVLEKDSVTLEAFEKYRHLHHKAAGRVTRPLVTFDLMFQWIQQGMAILCCAELQGKDVGYALILFYKDGAYYGSSCEDPDHNHLPIGHVLQWKAIQWLKQHKILHYEIGVQPFASQPHAPVSDKELNIAFFKRGFGGFTVPFWRAEKFYSSDYYLCVAEQRMRHHAEHLSKMSVLQDQAPEAAE